MIRTRYRNPPLHDGAPEVRVLIVEDSLAMAGLIRTALQAEGMVTQVAATGAQAIARKASFRPNVVLIDLGLPDIDGFDLVARFAQEGGCGVIVVTGNETEAARVAGLDSGADDYVVKPTRLLELAARIRAVHRRLVHVQPNLDGPGVPRIFIDAARRSLTGPGQYTSVLTEAEFSALQALLDAEGNSVSREALAQVALKREIGPEDRGVDQLVLKLRQKLAPHGVAGTGILSSRGLGYVIPKPSQFARHTPAIGQAADNR